MAETPIQDALTAIGDSPDGVDLRVEKPEGESVSVTVHGAKDLGQPGGWSVAGAASYVRQKWSAWAGFRWRPKS